MVVALRVRLVTSQPWSKSEPRVDALPVLRACFPSMLSSSWSAHHVGEQPDAEEQRDPAGQGVVGHAEAVAEEEDDVGEEGQEEADEGDLLSRRCWGWLADAT